MIKQNKTLKLRIYPTPEQEILINKTFGCCRKIYNIRIAEKDTFYNTVIKPESDKNKRKELWKTFKPSTVQDLKKLYPYMLEPSTQVFNSAIMQAETAFSNFINSLMGKRKGKKINHPKFKSKHNKNDSFRECNLCKQTLDFSNKTIKIQKLGFIKFRNKRIPDFFKSKSIKLKSITVRKNAAYEYYASLLYEFEDIRKPIVSTNFEKIIGLDFSPAALYIDSNGDAAPNYIPQKQKNWKKLRKLSRRFARAKLGSKNCEKTRLKVARIENYIKNCRLDYIEKETLRLVRTYDVIGIEDLNLIGISRFLSNAKNMVDTSWGTFVQKLEYKAAKYNCQVVKMDRYFASSRICHVCGYKKQDLRLSDRSWICPECGSSHNRDHNAAINIKNESLNIIRQKMSEFRSVEDQQSKILDLVHQALLDGSYET